MAQPDPAQLAVCRRFDVQPWAPDPDQRLAVARNIRSGIRPLNGMRYLPEQDTCGWFLWAGELGEDDDFFEPMHVRHLSEWVPDVVPYLALLPGWQFLIAPGHEEVWFDDRLLDPSQYE
jgi:hypothetical protein